MISAVIVEDDVRGNGVLEKLVSQLCPSVEIHGICGDASGAHSLILRLEPDLVFLDVNLSGGDSLTLLERLRPLAFEVIFVSADTEYAVRAFKYAAVDFLLKPVIREELADAVKRAELRVRYKNAASRPEEIGTAPRYNDLASKIGLPTQEGFIFLRPEEITRCEANGAYSNIYYGQSKKLLLSKSLKEMESVLNEGLFCRVHHSCIINLSKVSKYFRGKGGSIEMEDGSLVPVSSRKKQHFLDKYHLIRHLG